MTREKAMAKEIYAAARAALKAKPDHLELARKTLAAIGPGNVIHAGQSFWRWTGSGVWNECDDKAIKQHVQRTLEANGTAVSSSTVSGVTDVLRNDIIGKPDVVNCRNGELELNENGWILHRHRREHYRTTQIPVIYDPAAHAPRFWQFLHDVFRDDHDRDAKMWSVLELIGYTLMSHANHERFVMLVGTGGNGKSVLLRVIEALAGSRNVAGVQPSQFDNKFQRANLHMKLANIVTELKQGEIIADAELKAITSGELTTVEKKNRDPFEMRAFATCWFGTNHLPHTRDFSDALFRRAVILTFNRSFSDAEQDHNLKDKLISELPGILNYALGSYTRAIVNGFTVPTSSLEAKQKWRMEADQVAQFVVERCIDDPSGRIAVDELYRKFRDWTTHSGVRNVRKRSNGSWITGLSLRTM